MRLAETVTFGGSGLDRAVHLRKDTQLLRIAMERGAVLPLWRGKPLLAGEHLLWVAADHPVLAAAPALVFLGLDDGVPRFAADVSAALPDADDAGKVGFVDRSVQVHPTVEPGAGFADLREVMAHLTAREAELAATAKAILQWHQTHGFCAACGARSEPREAGWQRTCPVCETPHFPRTDPVVIMLVTHGNSVLLGRSPGWPDRVFSLLAGFMEPGETIEAAARREVFEETGVRCKAVSYLASQPWPFPTSLMIGVHSKAEDTALTLDTDELEAARWVTREEMVAVVQGVHPDIRSARVGSIAEFILRNWLADRLD